MSATSRRQDAGDAVRRGSAESPNGEGISPRVHATDGLRDLLELLHEADRLLETFEGEFRDWVDPAPSKGIVVDRDKTGDGRLRLRPVGGELFPRRWEALRRVWFERPQRFRVELYQGGQLVRFGVREGDVWSRWDREQGITTAEVGSPGRSRRVPPLLDPPLFSPAGLVGACRFTEVRADARLGRRVLVAQATQRDPASERTDISFEFEFDAGFGTILRRAAFEDARCTQLTEALQARFGVVIEPERFKFRPPGRAA